MVGKPQGDTNFTEATTSPMRYLTRVDPSGDVRRTMDRFFDDSYWHHANWRMFDGTLSAKVDIHQDDDNLYLTASLPGVRPEDVEITLSGRP